VPGILLVIGGLASIFGVTKEISAILLSILGGAFLIRAFDVDRTWSHWTKPTPAGFIRIFTMVAGILLMLVSIPNGINAIDPSLIKDQLDILGIVTNKLILGYFFAGALPFLWMGLGVMFGGTLLTSWFKGSLRSVTDVLRIIVLVALYPIVFQFTNIMTKDESPFSLLPPFIIGLAVILISATVLFRKYRKKKGGEVLSE
jgi:putative membrane protein